LLISTLLATAKVKNSDRDVSFLRIILLMSFILQKMGQNYIHFLQLPE